MPLSFFVQDVPDLVWREVGTKVADDGMPIMPEVDQIAIIIILKYHEVGKVDHGPQVIIDAKRIQNTPHMLQTRHQSSMVDGVFSQRVKVNPKSKRPFRLDTVPQRPRQLLIKRLKLRFNLFRIKVAILLARLPDLSNPPLSPNYRQRRWLLGSHKANPFSTCPTTRWSGSAEP